MSAARWHDDRADAERYADELGWRIGQGLDGSHLLYRPGLPEPIPCRTWLAMATYLRDYLERRRVRGKPLADKPTPVQRTSMPAPARVTRLGMRPATDADSGLPMAKILP